MNFLENDTILFREDPDKKLYKIQTDKLDPILEDFNSKYKMNLSTNFEFNVKPLCEADRDKISKYVAEMNSWELIALQT